MTASRTFRTPAKPALLAVLHNRSAGDQTRLIALHPSLRLAAPTELKHSSRSVRDLLWDELLTECETVRDSKGGRHPALYWMARRNVDRGRRLARIAPELPVGWHALITRSGVQVEHAICQCGATVVGFAIHGKSAGDVMKELSRIGLPWARHIAERLAAIRCHAQETSIVDQCKAAYSKCMTGHSGRSVMRELGAAVIHASARSLPSSVRDSLVRICKAPIRRLLGNEPGDTAAFTGQTADFLLDYSLHSGPDEETPR